MNFKKVHGTQETRPPEVECCGGIVYVRKNIGRKTVAVGDDAIEVWEYDEAKTPLDQFMNYFSDLTMDGMEENSDATFDLADLEDENSNAIFEVAEYIGELGARIEALEGGN